MTAYYNEFDKNAAAWLRGLIKEGLIADGEVDERSIADVRADDLRGYTQCHFFAGIGGWSYALRLAEWPDDYPVWTGSCPCQPFSAAGKRLGIADERHLWPEFHRLIVECRPPVVFGEQVEHTHWIDAVLIDLEKEGFAVGAIDLPAACVNAPHFRYRTFFVAHSNCSRLERLHKTGRREYLQSAQENFSRNNWKAIPGVLQRINGISSRLDKPRAYKYLISGYGNAIVPQVAAEFIGAYLDIA